MSERERDGERLENDLKQQKQTGVYAIDALANGTKAT